MEHKNSISHVFTVANTFTYANTPYQVAGAQSKEGFCMEFAWTVCIFDFSLGSADKVHFSKCIDKIKCGKKVQGELSENSLTLTMPLKCLSTTTQTQNAPTFSINFTSTYK